MKLVTRAQWGARPSKYDLVFIASTKGVKVHYEGTEVPVDLVDHHELCDDRMRAIQASHLANVKEDYSDIAYNAVVCPHGSVYEGRGLHHRTGANGNATLNVAHYAVCAMVGDSGLTVPTAGQLAGIRDAIEWLRAEGGAGTEIRGHRDGYATTCPGGPLYAWVQAGAPRPTTPEDDMPLTADEWKRLGELLDKKNTELLDTRLPSVVDADRTVMVRDHLRGGERYALVRNLTAQVAALTATVGVLAQSGAPSVADITAAAKAGALAALADGVIEVDIHVRDTTPEGN